MQTLKVSAYAGLLLALPLILYQIYAFVLPAFSPREKQVALPAMLGMPFLFIAGVVFGYYTVVPRAIQFLQNFNTDSFDVLIQAQPYYKFVIMLLVGDGAAVPDPRRHHRRHAGRDRHHAASSRTTAATRSSSIAVLAMLLPGQDPVTMTMMMAPMYVLFEGSILFVLAPGPARAPRRRRGRRRGRRLPRAEPEHVTLDQD